MLTRLRCVVPLLDRQAPRRIVSLRDGRSVATVQALDWPGVLLEAGHNDVAEVDDLALAHHYVGLNADRLPISMEVREQQGFRRITLEPGRGWLVPAGHAFSLRLRSPRPHAYYRISIDPRRFEDLLGAEDDSTPVRLHPTYDLGGPQLHHLLDALVAEAAEGTPSGLLFVDTLTTALSLQLARQAGSTGVSAATTAPARGGLAPAARRRVLELMRARLDAPLSIDTLAREAGLSPAHFARAFKESTGRAPHQHLLALRLDRARRLLDEPGASLSDVALRTGFADQAHLTRFFKRQFGVTPGALQRSRRHARG